MNMPRSERNRRLPAGSVAVVTGGSRGLGLALARELAAQDARIVICGRDPDPLERARAELEAGGAEVLARPCDVGDRSQAESLVEEAVERFGRIDVLVNNAGVITVGPVESMSVADFEQAMATMFWGPLYTSFAVLPEMIERGGGSIVNITSIGGKISAPHLLPYSCAKFAAVGFSEGLQAEVARHGVHVLTVVPGFMRTGSQDHAAFEGDAGREAAWFSFLGNLPLTSMRADRAARRIVHAMLRGDRELTITPHAHVAIRAAALVPGITAAFLDRFDRLLPRGDSGERRPGRELADHVPRLVAGIQDRASAANNQRPDRNEGETDGVDRRAVELTP